MRTLVDVVPTEAVTIRSIPEGAVRDQLIRFGVIEGTKVTCLARLPGGTLVIQRFRQEIAIGGDLARQILIDDRS